MTAFGDEGARVRWAAVEWAKSCDLGMPLAARESGSVFARAHRLLVLLAMVCELPSGEIRDYSYADWGVVLGISEGEAIEAADILSACDLSFRTGELTRPGTCAVVCLPLRTLYAQVALSYECSGLEWPGVPPGESAVAGGGDGVAGEDRDPPW